MILGYEIPKGHVYIPFPDINNHTQDHMSSKIGFSSPRRREECEVFGNAARRAAASLIAVHLSVHLSSLSQQATGVTENAVTTRRLDRSCLSENTNTKNGVVRQNAIASCRCRR
jgi:hypothetical protein